MNGFKLRTTMGMTTAIVMAIFANSANAVSLVGINTTNQISIFDSSSVETAVFNTITGAAAGKSFIGIDLRPTDNLIYGVTTSNEIYTLDALTGSSSFVAALSNNIIMGSNSYGIDFNPVADRSTGASLRVVSSMGDNYAINVNAGLNAGVVSVQSNIAKDYTAISYANSDATTPSVRPANTALYYIDSKNDTLSVATSAFNNPSISLIGDLGVDVKKINGFDVTADGTAFAAILMSNMDSMNGMDNMAMMGGMNNMDDGLGKSFLYNFNLSTGQGTQLGEFNGRIIGLTVAAVPEPETYALLVTGLGLIGFSARRRNKNA